MIGVKRTDGSPHQKPPIGVHLGEIAIFVFDVLHSAPKTIECSKAPTSLIGTAQCSNVRYFSRSHFCNQFTQATGLNIKTSIIICTNSSIGISSVPEAHRVRAADMFGSNHILR